MARSFQRISNTTTLPAGLVSSMILRGGSIANTPAPKLQEIRTVASHYRGHVTDNGSPIQEGRLHRNTVQGPTHSTWPNVFEFFAATPKRQTSGTPVVVARFESVVSTTDNLLEIELGKDPAWSGIEKDIARWRQLQLGWDGYEAQPPRKFTLDAMAHFVATIRPTGIAPPATMIASDGEVSLHWDGEAGYAHISFLDDGHIVAILRRPGHDPIEIDEPYMDYEAPAELYTSLKALS